MFTNLRFGVNAEILGLPIQMKANGALVNSTINKEFSNFGFSIDTKKVYGKYYKKVLGLEENISEKEIEKIIGITEEDKKALINEAKYEALHYLVTHPKFIEIKTKIISQKDSFQNKIKEPLKDSTLLSALSSIDSIEQSYRKQWESRNEHFQQLKKLEGKIDDYKNKIDKLSDPNNLRSYLLSKGTNNLGLKDKLLIITKDFDLGQTVIDDNDFTLKRFPLNGINYQYKSKNLFGGVAMGNHQLASYGSFLTDANTLLNFDKNRIYFASAGYLKNDLTTYKVSFLSSNSPSNSDTLSVFPKENRVFSISAEQSVLQDYFVNVDLAYSNQDFTSNLESSLVGNSNDNLAVSVKTGLYSKSKNSKLGFGYYKIGSQFFTVGNPFLLNNRNGLELNGSTKTLNNRLLLKAEIKYNFSNEIPDVNSVQFSNWQIIGEGTLRIRKKHSISLRVMPNTNIRRFIKDQPAQKIINNLYSVQGNFSSTILKKDLLSVFQVSNFSNNFTYIDTSLQSNITHIFLRESLILSKEKSLNLTSMFASPDYFTGSVSDYLFQIDMRTKIKKINFSLGGQLLEQRWDGKMKAGVVSNIQIPLFSWGNFGFNFNYRRSLTGSEQQNEFVGSTFFRTNI